MLTPPPANIAFPDPDWDGGPITHAVRRVLAGHVPAAAVPDLLFLDSWERNPTHTAGHTLRARQIRRANPALAAEIRAEILASRRQ